jgi:serine/threonine protein phosphatase PrpC
MAISDGAGNAQSVAKRALVLLQARMGETSLGQLLRDETWHRLAKALDSALSGGPEATLTAAAVIGNQVVGVAVGDSRAYVVPFEEPTRLTTADASKTRLGSGDVCPLVFRESLGVRDILLLVSDGAWTSLGTSGLDRVIRSMVMKPFADVPSAILDEASRRGRTDDMTAVVLRLLRA